MAVVVVVVVVVVEGRGCVLNKVLLSDYDSGKGADRGYVSYYCPLWGVTALENEKPLLMA